MWFKVLFAIVSVLSFFEYSEGLVKIERTSAISPFTTTVAESNMPVRWQVEAAEYLSDVFELYQSNSVRARALSELFAATHSNFSWFVAFNSSYIYYPVESYYCQLATTTTGVNSPQLAVAIFAGSS
ncbi:uncharacterized protein LOC108736089 [Agrilus planipennis]|uniref:Uncharacterized protein LOC108736089 n=1 Tax=Agrilus planipennis TaxID=224129 RepID=A0A1W4WIW5_AGRPL|nr:uncharacterized protein LOC108736089 [Agrilus planipennis]